MKSEQEWRMAEKRGDRHKDNEGGKGDRREVGWGRDQCRAGCRQGRSQAMARSVDSRGPGSTKAEKLRRKTSHPCLQSSKGPSSSLGHYSL